MMLEVQCPPGTTIGHVVQTWHPFTPKFSVQNAEKQTVLRVLGPCCVFRCGGDVNFESRGVGQISKQWGGLLKEVFTDTDVFGIQFPVDLDVKMKAVLLGACFLIVSVLLLPPHPTGAGAMTCFPSMVIPLQDWRSADLESTRLCVHFSPLLRITCSSRNQAQPARGARC
uniref:Phospholipid scramblase n=1 Tax=Gopherus evgoodei TaxID=1825980 RepID=A0A8C4WGJ8_9SAUR